jgi:hypothetical protein
MFDNVLVESVCREIAFRSKDLHVLPRADFGKQY